jgi:hypothetical protein
MKPEVGITLWVEDLALNAVVVSGPTTVPGGKAAYQIVPLRVQGADGFRPTAQDFRVELTGATEPVFACLWEFGPVLSTYVRLSPTQLAREEAEQVVEAFDAYVNGSIPTNIERLGHPIRWWDRKSVSSFRAKARRSWEEIWQSARAAIETPILSPSGHQVEKCNVWMRHGAKSCHFYSAESITGWDMSPLSDLYARGVYYRGAVTIIGVASAGSLASYHVDPSLIFLFNGGGTITPDLQDIEMLSPHQITTPVGFNETVFPLRLPSRGFATCE